MTNHIKPNGEVGVCRAELECPFGNMLGHDEDPKVLRNVYEKFVEGLKDPQKSVEFHFVNSDEMTNYSQGDCAFLAKVLMKKVNGELVVVTPKSETSWMHMAVRVPDGRILDVQGLWQEKDFIEKYSNAYLTPLSLHQIDSKEFKNFLDGDELQFFETTPLKTANKIMKYIKDFINI